MISFSETLEAVERQSELLRSGSEVRPAVEKTLDSLWDYRLMLEHSHQKAFQSTEEVLQYIDQVLIARLDSIHDSLQTTKEG
jgi:hypothetical protein